MSKALRLGLLGGTFDPPHLGHLALARAARDQLALDELRWVPAGAPWQKAGRALAPAADRLAMVHALVDGEARMRVDDVEIRRTGPSYTVDTVLALRRERPDADLFLVVGQDQYARLHTWHRWRELLDAVTLAVAGREGAPPQAPAELAGVAHRMVAIDLPPVAVSSTAVRDAAARGADLRAHVGAAVAAYIECHHLYRPSTPLPARS
ncbi:nicotinate-nucleotide adenylyltransferase [Azohydromonas sediminis]|uniref:nicotinate-nucleotide adenylyltransferase n=1 Tax=Azohydromonas sediminis TaxID=2259674 RepID=UPI000E65669C|nr:nicotinate-nucleotide adenylyltransferase [Azohydromonas sediminis]